jgi:hypothetical protein
MPKTTTDGNQRECSNCMKPTSIDRALILQQQGRVIAVLCEECLQVKKMQITLCRASNLASALEYYQYFPLEA